MYLFTYFRSTKQVAKYVGVNIIPLNRRFESKTRDSESETILTRHISPWLMYVMFIPITE